MPIIDRHSPKGRWSATHGAGSLARLVLLCALAAQVSPANGSVEADGRCSSGRLRVDCHPDPNANESECLRRACCWSEAPAVDESQEERERQPSCFMPTPFHCYSFQRAQQRAPDLNNVEWIATRRDACPASGFPDDARRLKISLSLHGDSLINIKISEPDRPRFQPALPEIQLPASIGRRPWQFEHSHEDAAGSEWLLIRGSPLIVRFSPQADGALRVIHQISGAILFEAELGKLIYAERFIQLPTHLPSSFVYGLGQHMGQRLMKLDGMAPAGGQYAKSFTMFNYGHPPEPNGKTAYSSYPFYINLVPLERDGEFEKTWPRNSTEADPSSPSSLSSTSSPIRANESIGLGDFERRRRIMATGALMLNSNAMDILLHPVHTGLQRSRAAVTWRLMGGIVNLYLFAGPQPHDVVEQLQSLVGRPALPPVWALGYHQSKMFYNELIQIKLAWAKTRSSGIPMESVWTDIEFMKRGTSYSLGNAELSELVRILHDDFDMHYLPIVDPAISIRENTSEYEALRLANLMDLFASYADDDDQNPAVRAVVRTWTDSKESAILDFTHPQIVDYLKRVLNDYKKEINFDALWLDMNEPEVFDNVPMSGPDVQSCSKDEKLPYLPGGRPLVDRTLCMSADFHAGKHFDIHNLYAFYQSKAHYEAMFALNNTRRPFLISRSQFPGQAKYSGTWLGDLNSNFEHLRWSIVGMIESNWFGQPMIGADICGFFGSASDELCARWFSVGAFYPLARNHNSANSRDQDPGSMAEEVTWAARAGVRKRYSLLPYIYSKFYENHLMGTPLIRSVLFEFFDEFVESQLGDKLPQVDDQFMLGPAIMVAPVVTEGLVERDVYLPSGIWYDITVGLPETHEEEPKFDSTRTGWPRSGFNSEAKISSRLESLRKAHRCPMEEGCSVKDLYTPLGSVNVFLRGGQIVPTLRFVDHEQSIGKLWHDSPFFLEVALNESYEATGTMHWDDGSSPVGGSYYNLAHFWATRNRLSVSIIQSRGTKPLKIDGFVVYGVNASVEFPLKVEYLNSTLVYSYDESRSVLKCIIESKAGKVPHSLEILRNEKLSFQW